MTKVDHPLAAAADQVRRAQADPSLQAVIKGFFDSATNTVSYVVHDPASRIAAIIDPVLGFDAASGRTSHDSADKLVDHVISQGLSVAWLLETHAHADHLSAAPFLQEKLGGKIAIGEHITKVQTVFGELFNAGSEFQHDGSDFNHLFGDGDTFNIGAISVTVLHVPGHTPACVSYVMEDAAFVGDTMFMPDYGSARADFPGGDASKLYQSLRRVLSLPAETRIFLCHDYLPQGRVQHVWETTVAEQRASNIHAHDGVSEADFVTMREARDATLDMPQLMLPSVQVNMRAGHMPPAENNGVTYLKLPVNTL